MVGCCCRCAIFCLLESSPLLSCQPSRGDAEWQAFLSRLRDVPEPQSESRGVTDSHNFLPICGAWKAARCLSLGKTAAARRAAVRALRVLPAGGAGKEMLLCRLEMVHPVMREQWENFLWLLGPSRGTVMAQRCDTLWCIVCIASVCLGNEKGCPLPALWLASKCGLRKRGEREKYRVCTNVSVFFYTFCLKLWEKLEFWIMPKIRWSNWGRRATSTLKGCCCTSVQAPEEPICFLWPALSHSAKSSLRKCPPSKSWGAAKWESFTWPCHGKSCLPLGEKGVNELAHLLRHISDISSQNVLVFNEICVRNILSF